MHVTVLGPLELRTPRGAATPRGPKVRQILALLAMRANQLVEIDALIDELWDGEPPRTAVSTVRTHLYHLRRSLERDGSTAVRDLLVTRPSGYLLRAGEDELDVLRFTRLVAEGRALLRTGDVGTAAGTLARALDEWRGRCLADVAHGRLLAVHVSRLSELRTAALELRIDADLRLGRHRELVAELRGLTVRDPLNEWFHARLMTALARSGRRGEALGAYQSMRGVLAGELGIEPSPELQRLHAGLLSLST